MSARSSLASLFVAAVIVAGCKDRTTGETGEKTTGARAGEPLRVAAASDLALAFKDLGASFEKETGRKVEFTFGSTGLLAKQISEGAPYDVLAAANVSFVDDVVKNGACLGDTKALYARGRLVLWSRDPQALPKRIEDLKDLKYAKIAIANPEHAPYGKAAQQAMIKAGVWSELQPRMVYGENIQQTHMFARSGNAEVAFVALSLAISSPGNWIPIDGALHEPLDQALVAGNGGSRGAKTNEARAFIAYVGSTEGRAIMRKFGFLMPGDELPAAHN